LKDAERAAIQKDPAAASGSESDGTGSRSAPKAIATPSQLRSIAESWLDRRSFSPDTPRPMIAVVSGLPRCGTSMMMQVLDRGGLKALTDHIRTADEDNPKGYYELEKVKQIQKDASWVAEAEGKVFKMVSALLYHLPPDHEYKIVFMERQLDEILASQREMLKRMGTEPQASDADMRKFYTAHLTKLGKWLAGQPNMDVHYCSYNAVMADPAPEIERLAAFFDHTLDAARMLQAVDPKLYRQRR